LGRRWADTGAEYSGLGYGIVGLLATADNANAGFMLNNSANLYTLGLQNDGGGGICNCDDALVLMTSGASADSGKCTIDTRGDAACTGRLGADAAVDGGARKVSLYAMQSPESWFEDFGSGKLSDGVATVTFDPTFAQTVSTGTGYHVFLTPEGDCKGLYVSQKSAASFEVRELGGGRSSVGFDYRIVAKRSGYEDVRLADVTEKYQRLKMQQAQMQPRDSDESSRPPLAETGAPSLPLPPVRAAVRPAQVERK